MIFLKPIPAYCYSQAFWHFIREADPKVHASLLGSMRSYCHVISYKIDFDLTCDKKLFPDSQNGCPPTYAEFCEFIAPFRLVTDRDVTLRYMFGELRLESLDRTVQIIMGGRAYFEVLSPRWRAITILSTSSIALSAVQVAVAAIQQQPSFSKVGTASQTADGDSSKWQPLLQHRCTFQSLSLFRSHSWLLRIYFCSLMQT
jgi:hypothetical protein